jgi:hypothetical protein
MLVRRSNELRDAARMSFDCQVCVWFLLKEGNIIAVTGTGYDGNYIQLHWWSYQACNHEPSRCVLLGFPPLLTVLPASGATNSA